MRVDGVVVPGDGVVGVVGVVVPLPAAGVVVVPVPCALSETLNNAAAVTATQRHHIACARMVPPIP
jgi:hypothetical protein